MSCLFLAACYSPVVPDDHSQNSGTEGTSPGSSSSSGSGATSGTTNGSSGNDETGTADEPPSVVLTLDGSEDPSAITEHATLTLAALATDDGEITSVEFWRADTLLAKRDAAPFELDIAFSSVDSGLREFRAVATDDSGQAAEDELEVSVNIAGGNVEEVEDNLFEGAIRPVSLSSIIGGTIVEIEGRIYLSATQSDGRGILAATLPELETQWQRDFDGPLWSRSTAVGSDQLAVAAADNGSWIAYLLDRSDGTADFSWVLGPDPGEAGILGPHITSTPAGILATTTPTDVNLFDLDGNDLSAGFSVSNGIVTELITASDGGLTYVSFGDATNSLPGQCATNSDFCAQAVEPGAGVVWVTGLSEQLSGLHRSAPTDDGGAFVAAKLIGSGGGPGFELLKVTADGVVSDTAQYGEQAVDDSGDRVMGLAPDNKGGVVACGGAGVIVHENTSPSPFVAVFDPDLNLIWELRDFIDAIDGAYALACAVTDDAVFVYGLRDMGIAFVGDEPWVVGPAWLARISL